MLSLESVSKRNPTIIAFAARVPPEPDAPPPCRGGYPVPDLTDGLGAPKQPAATLRGLHLPTTRSWTSSPKHGIVSHVIADRESASKSLYDWQHRAASLCCC